MMMNQNQTLEQRFAIGLENLAKIDGEQGQRVIDALKDIAPDMAQYVIGFGFGEIYARKGLELRAREFATISALCALGTIPQLKVHIAASLNIGIIREEIIEIFIQMALYCGFPKALNAIFAAKEVFDELG